MTAGGTLEPLLQDGDFALASHQWSGHQRRGQRWLTPEKAIALLSDRLHIVRCGRRITQGRPNLPDTHAQHDVGDVRPGPHLSSQLSLRHQTAGMLDQILQHRQRAGTQGHGLLPSPQTAVRHIETERSKGEVMRGLHRGLLDRSLNSI